MSPTDPNILARQLERARAEIRGLERLIEEKSRTLFLAQQQAQATSRFLEKVTHSMASALLVFDAEGRLTRVNRALCELAGRTESELLGTSVEEHLCCPRGGALRPSELRRVERELCLRTAADGRVPVLFTASPLDDDLGSDAGGGPTVGLAADLRGQKKAEIRVRHTQKLESIGQLASGIAHELNTPIQFIGDSVSFLHDGIVDLSRLIAAYRAVAAASLEGAPTEQMARGTLELELDADLEFLLEELPQAAIRAGDGVSRVADIVRAMKEFAHPGSAEKAPEDLNAAILRTLTVARNEYKYVARIETELAELPPVPCLIGDVSQVLLNLLVNAAQAIEDVRDRDPEHEGLIRIRTRQDGEHVTIEVQDNGGGIPDKVRERVFDPFFTTKEVGRGSGQGLALAHNVIVEKHAGQLDFETEPGRGTTFVIRLPLHQREVSRAA